MSRNSIIQEINEERNRQETIGHTEKVDDRHTSNDWIALITRHAGLAISDAAIVDKAKWRTQMIRVAAIALASLESFERGTEKWRGLIDSLQTRADEIGEPVLIIPFSQSREYAGQIPYGVSMSQADASELQRSVYTVIPTNKNFPRV